MLLSKAKSRAAGRKSAVDKRTVHAVSCLSCRSSWFRPRIRSRGLLHSTPPQQAHVQSVESATRDKIRAVATEAQSGSLNIPVTALDSSYQVDRTAGGSVSVSYEEQPFIAQPLPNSGKGLKINQDLTLWRSRQQRWASMWQTNAESRRLLQEDAERGLRKALDSDSQDARSYVVLGKLLLMQRRYDEARQLYTDGCVATGNTSAYIWCSWAYLEMQTGDVPRSRKLFDAALVVDDKHAAAWHGWGLLEKKQGNYLRARDLWMKGIQKCRQAPNPYLFCSLAVMAAQLGKTDEARAWFEEGTKTLLGKASHVMWQAWAVMESQQGDNRAVRYLFKKSLQCQPRSRYVHLAWACWEKQQGNLRQAYLLMERGIGLNPTDPALYQALALMNKEAGRLDEARELMRRGLQADPTHIPLWQAWGVLETEQRNLAKARELFQQGIWADPTNPDVVYVFHSWGLLEISVGNHAFARELFKCGLRVDPRSDKIWTAWIFMETDLGNEERASELSNTRRAGSYEFAIPANFTTRPVQWGETVAPLFNNVQRWFQQFAGARAGAAAGAGAAPERGRKLRDLLPEDFSEDLGLEEILKDLGSGVLLPNGSARGIRPLPPLPQRPPPAEEEEDLVAEFKAKAPGPPVPDGMERVQPAVQPAGRPNGSKKARANQARQ